MENITHYPLLLFAVFFVALWLAALAGSWLRRRNPGTGDNLDEHIAVLLTATLTLLALIIGFTFSMAINRNDVRRIEINPHTTKLLGDLWLAFRGTAVDRPAPITALALSGMNDVINSQGYTQAAYWNRIPTAAWLLMAAIALCSNLLWLSFNEERRHKKALHGASILHLDCDAFDRRYRCPATWPNSRRASES